MGIFGYLFYGNFRRRLLSKFFNSSFGGVGFIDISLLNVVFEFFQQKKINK